MAKSKKRGEAASPASPASSGPAGSHFEAQVGAFYLLALLAGSEPRGLPETRIDSVKLQRAAEGHPLDDVIVTAHDAAGVAATLEIQVKRSISFAPADDVFASVVDQIVTAARLPGFWEGRNELAVATARRSNKIDGPYQDVLNWARQLGSAKTFGARIVRSGSASDDMRTFVATFKSHLAACDYPSDDETVWKLLRRFQILTFDFTAQGSAAEALARERAAHALDPAEATRAGSLWSVLIELALDIAASGGDRNQERLRADPKLTPFRLAGERRHAPALATLAEASRNALADISDQIGGAGISRHERLAAVHAGLDAGRYVEIRGDAGVGKSGLLKHFAREAALEGRSVVLSPNRTIPRGWTALRAALGFEGTAHELLSEVAANGKAILFVDNLDLFSQDERATVNDLVRAAAAVPGFAVVATARRDFGRDEPSWLPNEALATLGPAPPIMIGDLSDAELEELRGVAPHLASLLSDAHPARDVTRNLYRLGRLAAQASGDPVPQTELDMAEHWWRTADGRMDGGHRDRARLIRALAEQALLQVTAFDVNDHPAQAIDALIQSETLRDFGNDRVGFRHDVLREWAIAGLLSSDPDALARLPLERPAPAWLARGLELFARAKIERASDDRPWHALLADVSRAGAHGSWRRAVLLALVRSEAAPVLLQRAGESLLAEGGPLLRELIRTIRAVEVEPATKLFQSVGVDIALVPASLQAPSGPAWYRLIRWLLDLGDQLPAACIPEVADFYDAWCQGMIGLDPLTPVLLQKLYDWLIEIEGARDREFSREHRAPFGGGLPHDQLRSLESNLRTAFVLFSHRVPTLAAAYLRGVQSRGRREEIAQTILKFRGSLAVAAPAELAELTANALISTARPQRRERHSIHDRPFGFLDSQFLPASPAQGPFLELLTSAPQIALPLIRRLVDHGISHHSGGADAGADAVVLTLSDGERAFPWQRSYNWSRENGPHYAVASALMALEAWAHRRIEAGDSVEVVLSDVLGEPGAPAAYLLVAVDLILSHWPKSSEAAVPFLASPELLCLDRQRQLHDNVEYPDFFGLKEIQKEPTGAATLQSLKDRPSRRYSLDQLIGHYAVSNATEARERLRGLLNAAAKRLGPPRPDSNLGDPEFMVVHALNLVNPDNWPEREMELPDGSKQRGRAYVSPQSETDHLTPLQGLSQERLQDSHMQASISVVLEDPSRSSPDIAAAVVAWARRQPAETTEEGEEDDSRDSEWLRRQAIIGAAMIAMRDGDVSLRAESREWAHQQFREALSAQEDPVHRSRNGLRYNPIAMAFAGMAFALGDGAAPTDIRALLDVAAREDPAAAHGFRAAAAALDALDEKLPRAILRCAFAARRYVRRDWDLPEEEHEARKDILRQGVEAAVQVEADWLAGNGAEPAWPEFPSENPQPRRRLRIPGATRPEPVRRVARRDEYPDGQGAALWLNGIAALVDVEQRPWLRDIIKAYLAWTQEANGAALDEDDDVDDQPSEWNDAYFALLANCLPGLATAEIDTLALDPIIALRGRAFLDIAGHFLRSVDLVFFNAGALDVADMVHMRSRLAERLLALNEWHRFAGNRSSSVENHVGEAVAAFFFNEYGYFQPPRCYLLEKAIENIDPFLPVLEGLVTAAPNLFVALVTMNLLEVAPKPAHLAFALAAGKAWVASYPGDTDFWIDHGIGRRFCLWLDNLRRQAPALFAADAALRADMDQILAALVSAGVPEAGRLETELA